ncbi:MAG: hypothetical protein RLZZ453_540 [Chlamydiota bacterium]|jgi:aspartate/glutamate racemase
MSSYPLPIGIIGGAGPSASCLFHEFIVKELQGARGCKKNTDFPRIVHLSFPFADHGSPFNPAEQLSHCISDLKKLDVRLIAIACNTLHTYLPEVSLEGVDLVHIADPVKAKIGSEKIDTLLVFCTQTSRQKELYQHLATHIVYPQDQERIGAIIDRVIGGQKERQDALWLQQESCHHAGVQAVLLGCTELSELHAAHPINPNKIAVLDPLVLLAKRVSEISFGKTFAAERLGE